MSKVFKLGVDARPLCHPKSGIGRYTGAILSELALNKEIELYLYAHNSFTCEFITEQSNQPKIRSGSLSGPFISTFFSQAAFPIWAHRDRLDLFWSPRHHLPLALFKPSAVTVHDMVWCKAPQTMQKGARFLESILMPLALRKAISILTVSESTSVDVAEKYPQYKEKTTTIPLAPFQPPDNAAIRPTEQAPFLVVGTIEPRKNLARIIEAYSNYAKSELTPRRMIIAGSQGWGPSIDELKGTNRGGEISFEISPSDAELKELYRNCHCLVMASLYEGFGLPILEAYSFGKPAITSNLSSMPEIAGPGALLVNPYSTAEISSALAQISNDHSLWQELAENALSHCSKFSWKKTADRTLAALRAAACKDHHN